MIKVMEWNREERIITLKIEDILNQATVPPEVIIESQWIDFLKSIAQPIVDQLILQNIYDPLRLIAIDDLSPQLLTQEQIDQLNLMNLNK